MEMSIPAGPSNGVVVVGRRIHFGMREQFLYNQNMTVMTSCPNSMIVACGRVYYGMREEVFHNRKTTAFTSPDDSVIAVRAKVLFEREVLNDIRKKAAATEFLTG